MNSIPTPRRQFLGTAGALAAGAFLAPSARAVDESTDATPVIYSAIKGGSLGKDAAAIEQRLDDLETLGFDGIEGASPGIRDVHAAWQVSDRKGMPIHGVVDMVHWNQRLSSPDESIREVGRLALEQAIRDSHTLRGSSVLLVPGRVSGPDENHDHVWKRSIREIRKVLPLASRLGIHVLIENVWNGFCEDPEQYRDYIDEINSPWVGAYFDIGNCRKFGPAEDWIRTLGRRIVKLDVKDWGEANGFCRLGEGDVDWPEVRRALVEIGFSGWATREGRDKSLEDTSQLIRQLLG